ncbi:hypothetical protein ACIRQQ_16420 [Streptomyces fuscichromogenes]|uniref:hypothetical protein n=1 Tax=Streptomyces fuscichromogenes TaxID=1324013 RepID=UPI0038198F4B
MGHWLERNIVEPGKLPLLLALTAFVLTFVITRVITRLIRAGKGPFRNVRAGGLHIHHVVPGVVLVVVGGFGAVAGSRNGLGAGLAAIVFGIGAGLVLDEFALILHLGDVYWTEEGRKSVEAVVITAALVGLLLAGFSPLGVNDLSADELQSRGAVIANVVANFGLSLVALSKGKARTAVFGVVVPLVALVGAVRLARPGSAWARRFYRGRPRARARAGLRAYHHDRRWSRLTRTLQDWIGGKPDRPEPAALPASAPGAGPAPGSGPGAAPAPGPDSGRR